MARSASPWRLDWATLLYRVHDVDALACACGGRLRFVDLITDAAEAQRVLGELGRSGEPAPLSEVRTTAVRYGRARR